MHALGNDFVVIDSLNQDIQLTSEQVRLIADRRFGVGCDQLLLLYPSAVADIAARYVIYNSDGGEVSQCGNGARCIASYLRNHVLDDRDAIINVETHERRISIHFQEDGQIRVNMGVPKLAPADIPILATHYAQQYQIDIADSNINFSAVSMGNPHAIIMVDNVASTAVATLGQAIQQQEFFPQGVNVGFMQIINQRHIKLRVYERGAGETLACGSGACAAVVAGSIRSILHHEVDVELSGGSLTIDWGGEGQAVWMTGRATFVYKGQISL